MAGLTAEHVRIIVRKEITGNAEINGLNTGVNGLKAKVDGLEVRFDGLEKRFDNLETKVDSLGSEVRKLGVKFEHFETKMDTIAKLATTTVRTREQVADLGPRVEALESQGVVQKHVIQEHSLALKQLRGEA